MSDSKFSFGKTFSRVKQMTEEAINSKNVEKTEFDPEVIALSEKCEKQKHQTERLLKTTETYLQPNPNLRLYEKLNKNDKSESPASVLGRSMIESGHDIGPNPYGQALVKFGAVQDQIGEAWATMTENVKNQFLVPGHSFLDGELKTIEKEKKELKNKRLDLDAAKSKAKNTSNYEKLTQAEEDLKRAKMNYDNQQETVRALLRGLQHTEYRQHQNLVEFAALQMDYFSKCHQLMTNLIEKLHDPSIAPKAPEFNFEDNGSNMGAAAGGAMNGDVNRATPESESVPATHQKARALYDYEPCSHDELPLLADDVVNIHKKIDNEWYMGECNGARGKFPAAYVELMEN
eukprot:Nk52_evm7s359 gene=Nk52_evmTU7s359